MTVRWSQIGFHHWAGAVGRRAYLSDRHRHLFAFTATLEVHHDDREVEFHDLLDYARAFTAAWGMELGGSSCEQLAERIGHHLASLFPGRAVIVTASEDGEVDATVTLAVTP